MDLPLFLAGLVGGLLRGGVGLFKYMTGYKDVEIRPWYFAGMVALTAVVGMVSAMVLRDGMEVFLEVESVPISFALVAGYAGGDFLENVFKIAMREPHLFEIGKHVKEIKDN